MVVLAIAPDTASVDADRLAALEGVIERGLSTFIDVGMALAEIRDRGLFRVSHRSFKAYVEDRWSFGQQAAYTRIYTAQVARAIEAEHGSLPARISAEALRPLVPLLNREGPEGVARAWTGVTDRYGNRHKPPSRSEVRDVLVAAGEITCAPERVRPPQIGQIGISLERALDRVSMVRRVAAGRPLPPEARKRASEFAAQARRLAAELDDLADDLAFRALLASREAGRRPRPGEVFCETHGRARDDRGVCVDCGVRDLKNTA